MVRSRTGPVISAALAGPVVPTVVVYQNGGGLGALAAIAPGLRKDGCFASLVVSLKPKVEGGYPCPVRTRPSWSLAAGIFDVDGVLLDSPHERAWREALQGFVDPKLFTTEIYQAQVAGKPRLSGAIAVLEALGVPDAQHKALAYEDRKQARLEELIHAGDFEAFPDALRFVQAVHALGWPMAVASSSHNANDMMQLVRLETGKTLLDMFSVNVCGRDLPHGKPAPDIFLLAAAELQLPPAVCFVVEDAPAGVEAARAGGMMALGVARLHDADLLQAAGSDLVVTSLDDVAIHMLAEGRLSRRAA